MGGTRKRYTAHPLGGSVRIVWVLGVTAEKSTCVCARTRVLVRALCVRNRPSQQTSPSNSAGDVIGRCGVSRGLMVGGALPACSLCTCPHSWHTYKQSSFNSPSFNTHTHSLSQCFQTGRINHSNTGVQKHLCVGRFCSNTSQRCSTTGFLLAT